MLRAYRVGIDLLASVFSIVLQNGRVYARVAEESYRIAECNRHPLHDHSSLILDYHRWAFRPLLTRGR